MRGPVPVTAVTVRVSAPAWPALMVMLEPTGMESVVLIVPAPTLEAAASAVARCTPMYSVAGGV
jgi:hypothetical protein